MFKGLFALVCVLAWGALVILPAHAINSVAGKPDVQGYVVNVEDATARALKCEKDLKTRRSSFKRKCTKDFPKMSGLDPKTDLDDVCKDDDTIDECEKCWKKHQNLKKKEKECAAEKANEKKKSKKK